MLSELRLARRECQEIRSELLQSTPLQDDSAGATRLLSHPAEAHPTTHPLDDAG
jgi:hypothetical protein